MQAAQRVRGVSPPRPPDGYAALVAEEVVPGVALAAFGYVNAFVVAGDNGVSLVDSGLPGKIELVRKALDANGGSSRLRNIVITHHHSDHTGCLAPLVAQTGASVWAHRVDARVIRGETPPPPPASRNLLERTAVKLVDRFGPHAPPARVDHEVADGEELGELGLVAYHTPGHTAGHLSFLMPSTRVLFVGDAAANLLGRLGPPVSVYNENHEDVKRSIGRIAALDFDVACFGHGRVLRGSACARFRRLSEKLAG